ncbi:Acyl-CoA N-acyltransferase,Histone acetyl transferase HAT1 N-terminal [Cinara cedri]|uniref:Histone acetyltransferase type B catalytic subunit n=1 Tax=Cinara cedri TaxID=506608 RepID=A0A5E4MBQ5_9HEMI|nr:Acyl-CoA N-acyltransferase,Histone acetyl transferase HAT1 N-terminal [Cinara cedri]
MEHYIVSSNTALELKLVRKGSDIHDSKAAFYPDMTYQVFGNVEKIFGYKDLVIKMYYAACSLKLYINISYSSKVNPEQFGVTADNIMDKLKSYISPSFFTNIDLFEKCLEDESRYKPFGIQLDQFFLNIKDEKQVFEVYVVEGENSLFKEYFDQLQTFVLWYIDSSNFIDIDDTKWTIFIIYEIFKNENGDKCYSPVGYSTVYEYYAYPDKIRPRISQMLILPPFQRKGLCAKLLNSLYKHYATKADVVDITVESPNDEFQLIRDFVDVDNFHRLGTFDKEKFKKLHYKKMVEEFKDLYKINQKQIRRVIEIILLEVTNRFDKEEYKKYKDFVKSRLNWPFQKKPTKLMLAMPAEEIQKIQKPDSIEKLEELDFEFKELEFLYDKVIKRLEINRTA